MVCVERAPVHHVHPTNPPPHTHTTHSWVSTRAVGSASTSSWPRWPRGSTSPTRRPRCFRSVFGFVFFQFWGTWGVPSSVDRARHACTHSHSFTLTPNLLHKIQHRNTPPPSWPRCPRAPSPAAAGPPTSTYRSVLRLTDMVLCSCDNTPPGPYSRTPDAPSTRAHTHHQKPRTKTPMYTTTPKTLNRPWAFRRSRSSGLPPSPR